LPDDRVTLFALLERLHTRLVKARLKALATLLRSLV
jgi:hypothetical protein